MKNYEEEIKNLNNELGQYKSESEKNKSFMNKAMNYEKEIIHLNDEIDGYKTISQENKFLKNNIKNLESQIKELMSKQKTKSIAKEVKGDIIHNMKELELITRKINKKSTRIIINLLYKASIDSDTATAFHKKCDRAQNTIVLVETKDGKRFGGYTTCSWSGNCVEKEDAEAFLFSFDKMKTYGNIPGDDAIGCYPKFGPVFLGCQIKIFDNAFTNGGTTFERELNFFTEEDYELTGGKKEFDIKDIEVYEVIYEDLNSKFESETTD